MKPKFGFQRAFLQKIIAANLIPAIVDGQGVYQPEVSHSWLVRQGWQRAPDERAHGRLFHDLWREAGNTYADGEAWAIEIEIVDALAQWLIARGWEIGGAFSRNRADNRRCYTSVMDVRAPTTPRRWVSLSAAVKRTTPRRWVSLTAAVKRELP